MTDKNKDRKQQVNLFTKKKKKRILYSRKFDMTCNDFSHKQEAGTLKQKTQRIETYRSLYYS